MRLKENLPLVLVPFAVFTFFILIVVVSAVSWLESTVTVPLPPLDEFFGFDADPVTILIISIISSLIFLGVNLPGYILARKARFSHWGLELLIQFRPPENDRSRFHWVSYLPGYGELTAADGSTGFNPEGILHSLMTADTLQKASTVYAASSLPAVISASLGLECWDHRTRKRIRKQCRLVFGPKANEHILQGGFSPTSSRVRRARHLGGHTTFRFLLTKNSKKVSISCPI